jgi:hypothetical protein
MKLRDVGPLWQANQQTVNLVHKSLVDCIKSLKSMHIPHAYTHIFCIILEVRIAEASNAFFFVSTMLLMTTTRYCCGIVAMFFA